MPPLTVIGRQAVAPPDHRLLELVVEGRDRRQRNGLAVLARQLQVLQRLDRLPLGVAAPGHDVDQVDRVAHLGDARAADDAVQGAGDVLRGDAELARLVLQHVDLHHAGRLVPVEDDVAEPGMLRRRSPASCCASVAHLLDVRPADAVLHRPADRRARCRAG